MKFVLPFLLFLCPALAQIVPGQYIVQLDGEPAGAALVRQGLKTATAHQQLAAERSRVRAAQLAARQEIERRGGHVLASIDTVANELIVEIADARAGELNAIPAVTKVYRVHRTRKALDHAMPLLHITDAWNLLPNGVAGAGAGVKIGMLDTGITHTHPAFQDSKLTPPPGFPLADNAADMALTSNKIIVARNYTDDPSAEDIDGHGTATAMCAAGETVPSPYGTITGAAPKAFLGVYKIFGGTTNTDAMTLQGINDAVADGMQVINLSIVTPAPYPLSLDPVAQAAEAASAAGVIVVSSAGNEGSDPNTIDSPGTAPNTIAVGASENDRNYGPLAILQNAPPYYAYPGDNFSDSTPITAPVVDVATLDSTGLACNSLPGGSLSGAIALIQRGTCTFEAKINNAQAAGARAALLYLAPSEIDLNYFGWTQGNSTLPSTFIGYADGIDLKNRLAANPALTAQLLFTGDPAPVSWNQMASFSSTGPGVGNTLKPDLVAIGDPISTAVEYNDPNGELYDPSGYSYASGTSFSSPIVAGATAVLLGARPGLTTPQYRSLIVNGASPLAIDGAGTASVLQAGAGILNLLTSMQSTLASAPVSLGFGAAGSGPNSLTFTLSNFGSAAETVNLTVVTTDSAVPTLSAGSLAIDAGGSQTASLQFDPSGLAPGSYGGYVRVVGANSLSEIHIPYWLGVPGSAPAHIAIVYNDGYDTAGTSVTYAFEFRVTDAAGLPFNSVTPQVTVQTGAGRVLNVYPDDPSLPGSYDVDVRLDRATGPNVFKITVGNVTRYVEIYGM